MCLFLDSGPLSGTDNMRLDEWLARDWFSETGKPVFRLYGWEPYTLSLGFHQKEGVVDKTRLSEDGYGFVRRPTGGRAVFHSEEITYSVIMDSTGLSVNEIYEKISRALAAGLRASGFEVSFSRSINDLAAAYREPGSIPCFSISSRHEIQIGGRKLVGSAQRRYSREDGGVTVLQHGSILTGPSHSMLIKYLTAGDEVKRRLYDSLTASTIDLSEAGNRAVDISSVKGNLAEAVAGDLFGGIMEKADNSFFYESETVL